MSHDTTLTTTTWNPAALADALVRLRTDAHLSQRRLAVLAGVSNTAVSALEASDAPPPHPSALQKIARGLATSGTGTVDDARAQAHYLTLMRAAGYLPPPPTPEQDGAAELRRLIEARVGPNAEIVDHLVRRLEGRGPVNHETVQRVLDALLDTL